MIIDPLLLFLTILFLNLFGSKRMSILWIFTPVSWVAIRILYYFLFQDK